MKIIRENYNFIQKLLRAKVRVGVAGNLVTDKGITAAGEALVREFGSPKKKIPARPFLRPAVLHNKNVLAYVKKAVKLKDLDYLANSLQADARAYLNASNPATTGERVSRELKASTKKKNESTVSTTKNLAQAIRGEIA